jgi:exopolyphosphatase / guanosine-5'-triphosphate,3'-diphosphate pyrophosphatase
MSRPPTATNVEPADPAQIARSRSVARENPVRGRTAAVIDIGTSSIRMAIAEIDEANQVRLLESLSQGVALGKDTFTRGGIEKQTIEACVRVLKLYRAKLEEYGITNPQQLRVVATSAVREAANRLAFADRIYVATGLTVEPVDEAEVHRITYRSIQPLLAAEPAFAEATTIICEVGGGSTELLVAEQRSVKYSHSYRLGSLRLRQNLQSLQAPQQKLRRLMEIEIRRSLETLAEHVPDSRPVKLLALGGDIRFAAEQLIPDWNPGTLGTIPVDQLASLCNRILGMTEDRIGREYHLALPEAETLGPALLVYLELSRILGLQQITVSNANLRDGLLKEMVDASIWTEDFRNQIISSALELGRKYHFDEPHAVHVAELSSQLFDDLQAEHGLDARSGLLLHLAALLHEIGGFVSNTSLHKHSMYLIQNSELFGLSANDVLLIALVARYHRRASPKPTHPGFNSLDRDRRVTVSKLAAILRIAIALDASRSQRVRSIQCTREKSTLIVTVPDVDDLSVEQLALRPGRSLFEEIFGMRVLLRTQARKPLRGQSAQL